MSGLLPSFRQPPIKKSITRIWRFGAEFQIRRTFQKDQKAFGKWLKEEIVGLGPAFVKIGQFMSTRIDVFSKEITDELVKLQDKITPVPYSFIESELQRELGSKFSEFAFIDPVPIATASIGQVHKGRLKDGRKVAIKVQKPGIADEIKADLKILNDFNAIFLKFENMQAKEMDMLFKQYERFLSGEVNYLQELKHMKTFRKFMEEQPFYVAEPYAHLTTEKVLTMEYVEATKITDIKKDKSIDCVAVTEQLIDLFLNQIVNYGVIYSDCHAGNIGYNKETGLIVLYDFGNVITVSKEFRKNINNLLFAIFQKDVDEFLNILIRLKVIELENSMDMLELQSFFASFFTYLETVNFTELKTSILNADTKLTVKVKIDQDFLALFRVFSLLDGTCTYLNPKLNYIELLQPYSAELFTDMAFINNRISKDIQKLGSYPEMVKSTNQNMLKLNKKVSKISDSTKLFLLSFVVLDNVMEPEKLVLFLPLLIYVLVKGI